MNVIVVKIKEKNIQKKEEKLPANIGGHILRSVNFLTHTTDEPSTLGYMVRLYWCMLLCRMNVVIQTF